MDSTAGKRPGVRFAFGILGLVCLILAGCVAESPVIPLPPSDPSLCVWDGVERVVAVGDIHGDYDSFVAILQDQGLVDEDVRWIGGGAHLVQLGDVMDRGPDARKTLIAIARLEREALEAGGMVHFLPGNHEELNLAGLSLDYSDYVSIQQFRDFLPTAYRDRHDRIVAGMNPTDADAYWRALMQQEGAKEAYYRTFRRIFGRWISYHNVIIKVDGVVFVHGGISIADSRRSLPSINAVYRREFAEAMANGTSAFQFVFQPASPLWNRDFGEEGSSTVESDVKQILSNLKARAIVVGHTPTQTALAARFGGLVYMIDSNISSFYKDYGLFSALTIDAGGISFKWRERHAPKKRGDGLVPDPRVPRGLLLRARGTAAPGHA